MSALHKDSYLKTIAGNFRYARVLELERIRVPAHVIVGEDDTLTRPAWRAR